MTPKAGRPENALKLVRSGQACDVFLTGDALKQFERMKSERSEHRVRQIAQMNTRFSHLSELGSNALPDTHFKHEGNFPCGTKDGKSTAVFALKAWQFRIYGVLTTLNGRRSFIGLRAHTDKKKDKADRTLLTATAKDAAEYV